jgi:hypothetical protein
MEINKDFEVDINFQKSLHLPLTVELRKRKEKTLIQLSYEDLLNSQDKILTMLKKECGDLKSWFFIIVSCVYINLNSNQTSMLLCLNYLPSFNISLI